MHRYYPLRVISTTLAKCEFMDPHTPILFKFPHNVLFSLKSQLYDMKAHYCYIGLLVVPITFFKSPTYIQSIQFTLFRQHSVCGVGILSKFTVNSDLTGSLH